MAITVGRHFPTNISVCQAPKEPDLTDCPNNCRSKQQYRLQGHVQHECLGAPHTHIAHPYTFVESVQELGEIGNPLYEPVACLPACCIL